MKDPTLTQTQKQWLSTKETLDEALEELLNHAMDYEEMVNIEIAIYKILWPSVIRVMH